MTYNEFCYAMHNTTATSNQIVDIYSTDIYSK